MSRADQVTARLAELSGADATALASALREFDVRDIAAAIAASPAGGPIALNALSDVDTAGGDEGDVLTQQNDGSFALEAPSGGSQSISSPLDIPDCVLWLDASQIVGLSDGDPVALWEDLSTSGFDFVQATAANKPVYKAAIQNGLAVVRFDQSGLDYQYLDSPAALSILNDKPGVTFAHLWGNMDYSSQYPVIFYVSANGDPDLTRFAMADGYGCSNPQDASPDHFLDTTNEGTIRPSFSDVLNAGLGWTQPGFINRVIRCDWRAGGVVHVQLSNGGVSNYSPTTWVAQPQANSDASDSALVRLGCSASGTAGGQYGVQGDLGEIVVYDRALTSKEARDLTDYLSAKWATI